MYILKTVNCHCVFIILERTFGNFCPSQFSIFDHFAFVIIASGIIFGTGLYFLCNFTISPSFALINRFCTKYKIVPLGTLRTKTSSLKPITSDIFKSQCCLTQRRSVGKALSVIYYFLPDGAFFRFGL